MRKSLKLEKIIVKRTLKFFKMSYFPDKNLVIYFDSYLTIKNFNILLFRLLFEFLWLLN
jgi:hypothetical protein